MFIHHDQHAAGLFAHLDERLGEGRCPGREAGRRQMILHPEVSPGLESRENFTKIHDAPNIVEGVPYYRKPGVPMLAKEPHGVRNARIGRDCHDGPPGCHDLGEPPSGGIGKSHQYLLFHDIGVRGPETKALSHLGCADGCFPRWPRDAEDPQELRYQPGQRGSNGAEKP